MNGGRQEVHDVLRHVPIREFGAAANGRRGGSAGSAISLPGRAPTSSLEVGCRAGTAVYNISDGSPWRDCLIYLATLAWGPGQPPQSKTSLVLGHRGNQQFQRLVSSGQVVPVNG